MTNRTHGPARPLLVRVVFALLLYLTIEGISLAGLAILRKARGIQYFPAATKLRPGARKALDKYLVAKQGTVATMDAELGWVRAPNPEINAAGMRDDREHRPEPDSGVLRISAFGDSFTYGSDVKLGENWAKVISSTDPSIEILNYGVGGYGLDQAYLRYLKVGAAHHPRVVFIGFMSENIARNVNVYRGFYSPAFADFFFTKPRFISRGPKLELIPNPLKTLADYRRLSTNESEVLPTVGKFDFHFIGQYGAGTFDFSPSVRLGKMIAGRIRKSRQIAIFKSDGTYNEESEAYALTLQLFDTFHAKVLADGALPVIIVFPDLGDQHDSRSGRPRRYAALLRYFESKGYRYVDALDALKPVEDRYSVADLSVKWGHYSQVGNSLVARHILQRLSDDSLNTTRGVDRALDRANDSSNRH